MRTKKTDLENFPTSQSAQNMLATVTTGFYDKSYVGKWLYQVMGLEFDEAERLIVEELPLQFFPETATWGLMYHELKWGLPVRDYLSYDERRKLIYEKRDQIAPMTPYKMELLVKKSTGFDIRVIDIHDVAHGYLVDHPNKFIALAFCEKSTDIRAVLEVLNRIKQSHTTFECLRIIDAPPCKFNVFAAPCSTSISMTVRLPKITRKGATP